MRALAREQRRDRTADAAIRPRDDRDLALQPARPPIARFPIGFGFKAAFVARQGTFVDHPDRVGIVHALSPLIPAEQGGGGAVPCRISPFAHNVAPGSFRGIYCWFVPPCSPHSPTLPPP